ncbi:MAG: SPFH domain-containing protein, partial [Candidatus Woesearchaeota archaeon]|nr:SPFH domain-containing protein [Candidatus Woesearchaeota archaeon]
MIDKQLIFPWKSILTTVIIILILLFSIPSILVVIPPGTVGVDYSAWAGVHQNSVRLPGWSFKLPFVQSVIHIKTARDTVNMFGSEEQCARDNTCTDVALQVPSKEGLLITLDVSVLYQVKPEAAPKIVQELTPQYLYGTLIPQIRSVAREVTGAMSITELYGQGREQLQTQ